MCTKVTYIFLSLLGCVTSGSSVVEVVDQSQSGDLNVQVSLKNVEIVALLGGGREQYTDYDYNYDYAEMTIKPPSNATSLAATNDTSSTESQAALTETTTQKVVEITPKKDPPSTAAIDGSSTTPPSSSLSDQGVTQASVTLENTSHTATEVSSTIAPVASEAAVVGMHIADPNSKPSTAVPQKTDECRKGFHRNRHGECELKIKPSSTNALLKLVELSQRLKLRRAN